MQIATPGADMKDLSRVVKIVRENNEISSIYLEKSEGRYPIRKAGQFVTIRLRTQEGWSEPHPFTISCPPEEEGLRLTIKREGAFTSAVHALEPGTELKCMGPLGIFCRDIDAKPSIVMIAGGVGITPFLSVIAHFRNIHAENRLKLFWVNKTAEEIIRADEMKELTRSLNLKVIHNLSREDDVSRLIDPGFPGVVYEKGRLTVEILKKHGISHEDAFYLCGPPPMMESALKDLQTVGIDPASVQQEKFSWQTKA